MNDTVRAIIEYGALAVFAGTFLFLIVWAFRWWLKSIECLKDSHAKATQGFIETANSFNQTVSNHVEHETQALQDLTRCVDRLCTLVEIELKQRQ
jgi:hypothetical protein